MAVTGRSSSRLRLPPAFVSLTFVVAFIFLCVPNMPLLWDPDMGWHITTGDAIRAAGGLPATNIWSFSAPGQPWYIVSWVWDIGMSLIHQAGGLLAVFIFSRAFVAFTLALLAYTLMRRGGIGEDALILLLFTVGLGFTEFFTCRPYLFGYPAAILFQQILHQSREGMPTRRLLWLPAIMLLWVNVHGSFLVGFSVIGAYGLEALWLRRWTWFRQLLLVSLLCLLAALVNPYGFRMYDAVMGTLNTAIAEHVLEWWPFVFGNAIGPSMWLLLFVLASGFRDVHIPIADKILSFAWMLMMFFSTRHMYFFVLFSAPFVALGLQAIADQLGRPRTRQSSILVQLERPGMRVKMAVLALLAVMVSPLAIKAIEGENYVYLPDQDPRPAIAWLQKHAAGKHILNSYNLGGPIIYETAGTFPVFLDGRAGTAYSEEIIEDYIKLIKLQKDWPEIVDKYRLDGIINGSNDPFSRAYDYGLYHDRWKLAYHDKTISIFFKK